MIDNHDLLYEVFEKNLFQLTEEDPSLEAFAQAVVVDYLQLLARQGVMVPPSLRSLLEMDLREEVIDMTRKKTYGHSSLAEFRRLNIKAIEGYLGRRSA